MHLGVEEPFVRGRTTHPGVRVRGLGEPAVALTGDGRVVGWDPHFPGHRRLCADDDHGNRLEVLELIRG